MRNEVPCRRRPIRRRRFGRAVALGLVVALGAAGLAGCAASRDELGTAASGCYVDLPAALHAVHHHGTLRGVRLVTVTSLRRHAPRLYRVATAHGHRTKNVCLVAFGGHFGASELTHPIGDPTGRLAVVEFAYPTKHLLATLLVRHPPLAFGHYHL